MDQVFQEPPYGFSKRKTKKKTPYVALKLFLEFELVYTN